MPDDPRVQRADRGDPRLGQQRRRRSAATRPELLPEVREGWRRFRAIEAQVGALFPEPGSAEDHEPTAPEIGPPQVPGYELLEVLGRGGVGVVYKAVHLRLNRPVALKMLLAGAFATRAERQRFAREAEVVAGLRHPNVVQVYDVGDLDGRPYFTMEFVEGGSLAEMIAGTPRPARQAAELVATLAEAVAGGAPRRDRPPRPEAVQRPAHGRRHAQDQRLRAGPAPGGRPVADPDRGRGRDAELHGPRAGPGQVGRRSGRRRTSTRWGRSSTRLLTGRPPFRAESAAETVQQVITQDPVPPSRLNAKVPRDLETICLKCLRKDPRLRYADAAALADDLGRFLRGRGDRGPARETGSSAWPGGSVGGRSSRRRSRPARCSRRRWSAAGSG